jgi:hypothetical protein
MGDREKGQPDVSITEAPISNHSRPTSNEEPTELHSRTPNQSHDLKRWDDWWIWEFIGVIMSAAAICAIIGLLIKLEGKRLPDWGFKIKERTIKGRIIPERTINIALNSVISWISTVGKICILIPITKGIGQLKCEHSMIHKRAQLIVLGVWFAEQERQLSDFEKFENATRGLTGSAMLLWKLRGRLIEFHR